MKQIASIIDYENEIRQCTNCFKVKNFSEFTLQDNGRPRSWCKQCRGEVTYNYVKERKMELFPNLYWCCDACDRIFSIKTKLCTKCKTPPKAQRL